MALEGESHSNSHGEVHWSFKERDGIGEVRIGVREMRRVYYVRMCSFHRIYSGHCDKITTFGKMKPHLQFQRPWILATACTSLVR